MVCRDSDLLLFLYRYENANAGFSLEQLQSIRRSSLARVVCENMDDVAPKIPKKVFHIHGAKSVIC